ncbi:2414_t:CDS:2, partial [Ambispora leptoticha]
NPVETTEITNDNANELQDDLLDKSGLFVKHDLRSRKILLQKEKEKEKNGISGDGEEEKQEQEQEQHEEIVEKESETLVEPHIHITPNKTPRKRGKSDSAPSKPPSANRRRLSKRKEDEDWDPAEADNESNSDSEHESPKRTSRSTSQRVKRPSSTPTSKSHSISPTSSRRQTPNAKTPSFPTTRLSSSTLNISKKTPTNAALRTRRNSGSVQTPPNAASPTKRNSSVQTPTNVASPTKRNSSVQTPTNVASPTKRNSSVQTPTNAASPTKRNSSVQTPTNVASPTKRNSSVQTPTNAASPTKRNSSVQTPTPAKRNNAQTPTNAVSPPKRSSGNAHSSPRRTSSRTKRSTTPKINTTPRTTRSSRETPADQGATVAIAIEPQKQIDEVIPVNLNPSNEGISNEDNLVQKTPIKSKQPNKEDTTPRSGDNKHPESETHTPNRLFTPQRGPNVVEVTAKSPDALEKAVSLLKPDFVVIRTIDNISESSNPLYELEPGEALDTPPPSSVNISRTSSRLSPPISMNTSQTVSGEMSDIPVAKWLDSHWSQLKAIYMETRKIYVPNGNHGYGNEQIYDEVVQKFYNADVNHNNFDSQNLRKRVIAIESVHRTEKKLNPHRRGSTDSASSRGTFRRYNFAYQNMREIDSINSKRKFSNSEARSNSGQEDPMKRRKTNESSASSFVDTQHPDIVPNTKAPNTPSIQTPSRLSGLFGWLSSRASTPEQLETHLSSYSDNDDDDIVNSSPSSLFESASSMQNDYQEETSGVDEENTTVTTPMEIEFSEDTIEIKTSLSTPQSQQPAPPSSQKDTPGFLRRLFG